MFGKLKIKDNVKLTNKEKDTLNFDISRKISEKDIVDHLSTIYHQNNGRQVPQYCNEIDIMMNANKLQHSINPTVKHQTKESRPRFRSNVKIELSDVQEIPEVIQFHVDQGDISRTPLLSFSKRNIKKYCTLFVPWVTIYWWQVVFNFYF